MSRKKKKQQEAPEEEKKLGYTFWLDPASFGNANHNEIMDFIDDMKSMMDEAKDTEQFLADKSEDWWGWVSSDGTMLVDIACSRHQQWDLVENVWRQLKPSAQSFGRPEEMDPIFTQTHNAFIGVAYSDEVKTDRYIVSLDEKRGFIESHEIFIPKPDFWDERDRLYPRLIFGEIEVDFVRKHADYYESLFKRMNDYCENDWTEGNFRISHFNDNCDSSASDESVELKKREDLAKYRYLYVPGIGKTFCFLHLKHGSQVRTHFYPYDKEKKLCIAYTGPHLPTIKDPK